MASRSINMYYHPMTRPLWRGINARRVSAPVPPVRWGNLAICHGTVVCSAAQESATATVTDKKEEEPERKEAVAEKAAAPAKAKPAAKVPAKGLKELMEEEVIPSLKETLVSQEDISQIGLSFGDNRLEGSFLKKDVPYYFWAFFPEGVLTGPKGFSLSSYGSGVSTVEPFLIDEKKITSKHVVFWVVKRLAAQGILPVWKE